MTETPPDPVLLLKIIEDLCAAIAQATGLNLFTRLMLIPVRRKLRGMANTVAEVVADRAARAPDALTPTPLAPHAAAWGAPAPDATQAAAAAPVIPDAGGIPEAARPARAQRRTAPTRTPAALGSHPAPVALGVAVLHAAVTFALGPLADRNAISGLGFCARYLLR